MQCYDVTVGDCIGDDVEKGTVVEACTPLRLAVQDGLPGIEGEISFVQTDDIGGMMSNPAMVRPRECGRKSRTGHYWYAGTGHLWSDSLTSPVDPIEGPNSF